MKELKVMRKTMKVENNGTIMTFTHEHEWLRIHDADLHLVTGTILHTFAGSEGIFMIMRKNPDPFSDDCDEGFVLLLNTVKEDTGSNILLFTEVTRDEVDYLCSCKDTLNGPIW